MNRRLLATLLGMGIGFTAVAEGIAAPDDESGVLSAVEAVDPSEVRAIDEARAIDPPEGENQSDTPEEPLRLWLEIIGPGFDDYLDAPTDAWRDRVSLHRLA